MKVNRVLTLAMSTALVGTALGCAPAIPNASTPAQAPVMMEGAVAPDQLIAGERQIMVDGKAMSFDEIRKNLPSRLTNEEAKKLLVEIDTSKIVESNDMELQQRGRGFARGFGGYGRGLGYGRGFARGFGRGFSRFGRGFYGSRFYGFGGSYWPYYNYGNYWYPYSYAYAGLNYWPYMYGYGGSYYPYSYCW